MCFNHGTLMAYVEGELPPADELRVAEHLQGCPRCRETADDLRAAAGVVDRHLAAYTAALTADGFDAQAAWARLQARLHRPPRPHWFQRPWVSIVAMAAVVCLTFGIGLGLRQFESGQKLAGLPKSPVETPLSGTHPGTEDQGLPPVSEVPVQREELHIMAGEAPLEPGSPSAGSPSPESPSSESTSGNTEAKSALSTPAGAQASSEDLRQPARGANGQDGNMVHAFSVPELTREQVLSAKFVKDQEGIRLLNAEEIDRIVDWLKTGHNESYTEEPPPSEELRLDLKGGRQIAVGAPQGETVLVSGLHGPGRVRLTSPELASFLTALLNDTPAATATKDAAEDGTAPPPSESGTEADAPAD